jgi:glucokinase
LDATQVGLLADIGRHSVRFALSGGRCGNHPREVRTFSTVTHNSFTSALLEYVEAVGVAGQALPSVLAVAGMTRGDIINLTGSRWYISLSGVQAVLRARPIALNEAAAVAMALILLPGDALSSIGKHPRRPVEAGGRYLLVSLGTGLGVAALITTPNGALAPVQSEAGHITFAPSTPEEGRFFAAARLHGPVSAETLVSASGLVAAYAALSPVGRTMAKPEDVTNGFGRDATADAVGHLVAGYFGSFIGDMVLAFGAWDGIYITGAVGRALQRKLDLTVFRHRLENKDAHRRQLAEVPVSLINRTDLELLGAAATFDSR